MIAVAGGDTATPLSVAKRLDILERAAQDRTDRVLDLGCGRGGYVDALARRWEGLVCGVEIDQRKVAARAGTSAGGQVACADVTRLPFGDGSWDVVMFNEVLEHVPDDAAALAEAHRVLRPGGRLVVFSPNRFHPFETHGLRLSEARKLPPSTPFVPYVPARVIRRWAWARNYWPWQLRRQVAAAGFRVEHTSYVWQTFEGLSRSQPAIVARFAPTLRRLAARLERTPVLHRFGVSQLILASKVIDGAGPAGAVDPTAAR